VTGTAANLNPKKTATYSWTADGGTVSGTGNTANVDTKTLNAGSYTVKGHVTEGNKPGEMADCSAPFTIQAYGPPSVSCSANPSTVAPGDSSTITANGSSPQNRPLTYSYSSTAGSVTGNTSTATLNTTGAAPGTITVTANVVDDKGQTASCTATVTVVAPAPPPAPTTQALCSITFDRDKKRPTRVDNEAKACLDDIALNMQRSADAKLAVVGNAANNEKAGSKAAASRAVNAKDYLVTEKGIDASRISVYTGSQDGKSVNSTIVPTGATLDQTGLTAVDESAVKAVARTPAKKKKK
jgi:outer membrane protein OmpA-like peptidoglycan-associated protein